MDEHTKSPKGREQSPEQIALELEIQKVLDNLTKLTGKKLVERWDRPNAVYAFLDETKLTGPNRSHTWDVIPSVEIGSKGYVVAASRQISCKTEGEDPENKRPYITDAIHIRPGKGGELIYHDFEIDNGVGEGKLMVQRERNGDFSNGQDSIVVVDANTYYPNVTYPGHDERSAPLAKATLEKLQQVNAELQHKISARAATIQNNIKDEAKKAAAAIASLDIL
ncbi:hypothetical protein FJZ28_02715 [Candidatus Peregrinibacteria bacterium]|nr:hypothetical protein [Candidatus Peregrinibacteria bacterium]